MKNFYEVLGVSTDASQEEIKSAWKKLAKENHPDLGGDEDRAKEVNEAYDTLKDPQKRNEYDLKRQYGNRNPFHDSGFSSDSFGIDLGEIFRSQFGSIFRKSATMVMKYEITLEDAFYGIKETIQFENGKVVDLELKPGIINGTKFKVKGAGPKQHPDWEPGDIIINVVISDHPDFIRNGKDLYILLDVDVIDCIIGTIKEIRSIDSKIIKITIPSGTDPGTRLKVKGKGMPIGNMFGDLFVEIKAKTPKNITEEQRKILENFKKL